MKPAELVNNLGMLHWIVDSIDEGDLKDLFLETIRTCQLIAMRMTMEELNEIKKGIEEDVHI